MSNFETFLNEIESIRSREDMYAKMRNQEFFENLTKTLNIDDATSIQIEQRITQKSMRAFLYFLPMSANFLRKMILRAGNKEEIVSLYKAAAQESLALLFDGLGSSEIDETTMKEIEVFKTQIEEFQLQKAQEEHELRALRVQTAGLGSEVSKLKRLMQEQESTLQRLKEQKKDYAELGGQFSYYKEEQEAFAKTGDAQDVTDVLEKVEGLLNSIKDQMSFDDDQITKIFKD